MAATFDIANVGGSSSGSYYFTAYLPTIQGYNYTSPRQASLAPGAHIVNTLRFTQANGGSFSVSVDPSNAVRESNERNNYASQPVGGSAYLPNYGPQYSQPYNTYQYPAYTNQNPQYSNTYSYPSYNQYSYPQTGQLYTSYSTDYGTQYNQPSQNYPYMYNQNQYPYTQYSPYSTYYPYTY